MIKIKGLIIILQYNDISEIANYYFECIQTGDWENFNFPDACRCLKKIIDFSLISYGHCSEETFVRLNLQMKFPDLTEEDIEHCHENEDDMLVVNEKENKDYSLKDLLPAYRKLEAMRFKILEKEYQHDLDLIDLYYVSNGLRKVACGEDDGFPQMGKILLINKAFNAKNPRGFVFDFMNADEIIEN